MLFDNKWSYCQSHQTQDEKFISLFRRIWDIKVLLDFSTIWAPCWNGCAWGLQSNWNCSAMVLIVLEPLMVWLVWNMSRVNVFTFLWRYFHLESCPSGEKVCRQEHGIDIFKIRGVEELEHWKIWFSRVLVVVWTWMRCLHGYVWDGFWIGQYWKCGSDHFSLDKFFLRGYQEMDSMFE